MLNTKSRPEVYNMNTGRYKTPDGKVLEIVQDCFPESPREDTNTSIFCFFHNRYDLPQELEGLKTSDFDGWEAMKEHLQQEHKPLFLAPVSMTDHTNVWLEIGELSGFDSGQVWFVMITADSLAETHGDQEATLLGLSEDKDVLLQAIAEEELDTYNKYLAGNVYGYRIYDANDEEIDSCWWYYETGDILDATGYNFEDLEEK